VEEAIRNKNVIIVSIPQKNVPDLPKHLVVDLPKDVLVIDTCNYYPDIRDGIIPELEQSGIDSLWVQQQPGIPVVKVFNSITAGSITALGRPKGDKDRIALAVSGDNAGVKEVAFGLVEVLGFDPFNVGTIAQSWKQQPGSSIYCRDLKLEEIKKRVLAMEDDWSAQRELLAGLRLPADPG
jgi:8-hydroxy-5-deazaflavin:NADPH oxidoreductase